MFPKLTAVVLAIVLLNISSAPSFAQAGDPMVYLGGGPIASSTSGTPGSTVTVPVLIVGTTGMIPSARFEITVPKPLRTLATSTCTAETITATAGAESVYRPCEIVGWDGPQGSQIVSAEIEELSTVTGFRISAWLQIEIPRSTPIGSSYTLTAPSIGANGFPTLSEFTVYVVSTSTGTSPAAQTVISTVTAKGPLNDINGSELEFPIGSIKPFSFKLNYDAYPEATSASLRLYSDTGMIEVTDPSVVDMEAEFMCDSRETTDKQGVDSRRQPIGALPSFFNLSLPRWLEPRTEIHVCAEVIYFDGTTVVGSERYKSVIEIVE